MTKPGKNLRMFLFMTLLLGIGYPLVVTLCTFIGMRHQAVGSIVYNDKESVGALLIGQKFESDRYFWGRPSFANYDAQKSGGSNLGPTSAILKQAVDRRRAELAKAHHVEPAHVPRELLFASGSGLDPNITPYSAYFQAGRVAKARGWTSDEGHRKVQELIAANVQSRRFGFLGPPTVNILTLNMELDKVKASHGSD